MKKLLSVLFEASLCLGAASQTALTFDANAGVKSTLTAYDGTEVSYTAFPVPINFATRLQNAGKDVNFLLAWNRPHSGDYALDELFEWIAGIVRE